jgi:hypothetical protein
LRGRVNQSARFALPTMTTEERQLLEDTARNLLLLLRKWDDTIAGMSVAITELYRADAATLERKAIMIARLKLRMDIMRQNGEGVQYLESLVSELNRWGGFDPSAASAK